MHYGYKLVPRELTIDDQFPSRSNKAVLLNTGDVQGHLIIAGKNSRYIAEPHD